ncbi:hypothetical protein IEQ34_024743 [Dendrobium chrysotoxum]|uniref:Uncharacterized protein n=1 Tax=Dendrobium chrysotoxum TaxID=161865 RepID=A0AAV7FRP4_DENCH|nr:hypothetical protein IEQ34_024743 [Dendrobium chrysotoxum]
MEVPGSCEIRLVPNSDFIILFGKLAMEMTRGQRFFQTKRGLLSKQESRFDPIHSWGPKKTLDMSVTLHEKALSEGMECIIFW